MAACKFDGCGGFDLLCCSHNTKLASQSPRFMESVVGNRKVFIHPIQQDIDLGLDEQMIRFVQ